MATPEATLLLPDINMKSEPCQDCLSNNERHEPLRGDFPTNQLNFEHVSLINDDGGDIADISDDEIPKADLQNSRHKKKVKKKRRTKSVTTSNEEDLSTDEEDVDRRIKKRKGLSKTDVSNLTWMMWIWYYIAAVSVGAYHFAEYLGEKLADFFGITTPKYQYVIDEYYRMKREEKEEEEKDEREKEHVQKKQADRLAQLEGGDELSEQLKPQQDPVSEATLPDK